MTRITDAFADEPALIPYITAGDPDLDATPGYVDALVAGGADIIELGLPFSEPIADGPTIQSAITRALDAGTTPDRFFAFVDDLDVPVPLVVMTYYNLIYQYGTHPVRDFVETAAAAGINGVIVPDLPAEESTTLRDACTDHGLDLIFIVAPTTTPARLERIMDRVSGFVYVQARLGTTGARTDVSAQTHDALHRLTPYDVPKAVGFGVSTGDHAEEIIRGGADGVVAGSVFVDLIADATDVHARLEAKAQELKAGVRRAHNPAEPEHQ